MCLSLKRDEKILICDILKKRIQVNLPDIGFQNRYHEYKNML